MVIVQLLAADENADGDNIGGGMGTVEIAVALVMADAVDDARGAHRNPQHLHAPDGRADRTEHQHVRNQQQADPLPGIPRINVAFQPVDGGAGAVALQRRRDARLAPIQFRSLQQDLADPEQLRAVRIALFFAVRVVLAMNRDPLARDHAGGEPEPEAEYVGHRGVQLERAVGLASVQVDRHRDNRQMGGEQGVADDLPGIPPEHAAVEQLEDVVHKHSWENSGKRTVRCHECKRIPPTRRSVDVRHASRLGRSAAFISAAQYTKIHLQITGTRIEKSA